MKSNNVILSRFRFSFHREVSSFRYILPLSRNKRALDAGCGDGVYLKHSSEDSVGVDINGATVKRAL